MKILDFIQLLLLASLWGSSFLFLRMDAPILGPIWLIEIRLLLSGLIFIPYLIRKKNFIFTKFQLVDLIVLSLLNTTIPYLLFAFGSIHLTAGLNSILCATTPLFGIIIANIWLKEKLTFKKLIGLILGFAGVIIVVDFNKISVFNNSIIAIFGDLLGSFFYALGANYIKCKFTNVSPLVITSFSLISSAFFLIPFLPFSRLEHIPSLKIISSIIFLAFICTSLAYLIYFKLIKNIGSTKALMVHYLIPFFSMIWGNLFLQEIVTSFMLSGSLLIILGTLIALL